MRFPIVLYADTAWVGADKRSVGTFKRYNVIGLT